MNKLFLKSPRCILFFAWCTVSGFSSENAISQNRTYGIQGGETATVNNHDSMAYYAAKIELIKLKMTKETVIQIIGQPVYKNRDAGEGTWTTGTKEMWLYGAACPTCYAKYGTIYFDSSGAVQYVYDNKVGNDGSKGHADEKIKKTK